MDKTRIGAGTLRKSEKRRTYNLILDNWLSGKLPTPTEDDTLQALGKLKDVARDIEELTDKKEY